MKKTLFTALLGLASLLVATTSQASLFWADTITNYPLGCITTNNTVGFSSPQWISHLPGTGVDALIQSNNFGNSGTAMPIAPHSSDSGAGHRLYESRSVSLPRAS